MFDYANAVRLLLQSGTLFLTVTMCLCLIRAVRGPKLVDRLIAVNMICVKTILLIVTIGVHYHHYEAFLIDVAIVYALLSFLAIVVLTKFMLQAKLNKLKQLKEQGGLDNEPEKEAHDGTV